MQLIPVLLVGCVAAVVAQLPPRPEQIPGAEPVREPAPQRLSQYRRPTHRAYQDQPQQQQPERVIRVRRPTSRGRHVAVPPQPKQDYVSLTPRPVSEDPDSDFDAPAPPPPTRRRPSPPPPAPAPATPSPARRPVLFRPERVNQVSPAPAPNVHVHQLLREDDDYLPVARPTPAPRPVRPQPTPQPQPRPVVKPRPPGNTGNNGSKYQRDKKPVAQVLRRYREDNPDGSITWGYENDDGSFKEETIGVDCMVRGKYGYIDPDGNRREYTYQSGIPCTPAPPGQQADDQEGGYIDYQNNQYVLPNGDAIDLDNMVKNRKRKPVAKNRNFS